MSLSERPRGSARPTPKEHYNSLPRTSIEGALGLLLGSVARPEKKVLVGLWGIVGVAEWVAYFVDYHTP